MGVAIRIPDLVWECELYISGSHKHFPSCRTSGCRDLELPLFHIPFHLNSFGEHWTPLLSSSVRSVQLSGDPSQSCLELQPRKDNSFTAFLELFIVSLQTIVSHNIYSWELSLPILSVGSQ